nr:RHS repeat-associated core domain-containing protein [Arthrobacter jiangjiafuii]
MGAGSGSGVSSGSLPAGISLTGNGGLDVAGLEWLGARAYDPTARGFLSTDPLAPVLGAGWDGNPYAYAGNNPLNASDPTGLRPLTDEELKAYDASSRGAFAAVGDWMDDHAYLVAGIAVVAGVALMCTGVGGPVGVALIGAASGALISGGVSIASQKAANGNVDWGQVGVDTLIGGAAGLAGGGAAAVISKIAPTVARAAPAVARAGRATLARLPVGQMGKSAVTNALGGGVSNTGMYLITAEDRSFRGVAGAFAGGAVTGAVSPQGGYLAPLVGGRGGQAIQLGIGAGGAVAGGAVDKAIAGKSYAWQEVVFDAAGGGALSHFPGASALNPGNSKPGWMDHSFAANGAAHASAIVGGAKFVLGPDAAGILSR